MYEDYKQIRMEEKVTFDQNHSTKPCLEFPWRYAAQWTPLIGKLKFPCELVLNVENINSPSDSNVPKNYSWIPKCIISYVIASWDLLGDLNTLQKSFSSCFKWVAQMSKTFMYGLT